MGKAGRFACIFTPMAMTIASLICLVVVLSGQAYQKSELSRGLYFFKADTTAFKADPDTILDKLPEGASPDVVKAFQGAASGGNMRDIYQVGLWNYCEADLKDGKEENWHCTDRQNYFWFNPFAVWKLENTSVQAAFPEDFQNGIDTYHKVSRWMFISYMIALVLTIAEVLLGISAIFSRWGSLITTIVSTAQTLFIIAAAATSTALYGTLISVFRTVLDPYQIEASWSSKMLSVLWIGVAFSIGSGFFWLISVCCCSGKSGHKKVVVEKTPYTYERVASPYMGASANAHNSHQMHPIGHGGSGQAYEPYRGQHV
ncbi:hypothetical protein BU23DRAFT_559823 [Bimuria novae-zelandiae CBS 107.79]|uniref:Integral membrane protein-like protein n=1 Tax=Bimuria novae-zelandiae CBS 107.79 TaxID=1447943 RepID=A0A6A5UP39_9PLEO|nr:hypothetical protein BU23DRAFT_559823 [Bimuria novae-zelandiae CBS 107.79]